MHLLAAVAMGYDCDRCFRLLWMNPIASGIRVELEAVFSGLSTFINLIVKFGTYDSGFNRYQPQAPATFTTQRSHQGYYLGKRIDSHHLLLGRIA